MQLLQTKIYDEYWTLIYKEVKEKHREEPEPYFFRILATSIHLDPSHQYECLHLLFQISLFFCLKPKFWGFIHPSFIHQPFD